MKTIIVITTLISMLLVFSSEAKAQGKPLGTMEMDTISIAIPERQMKKLAEIERLEKEISARREDILLDLLAVGDNAKKIEGAAYVGIKPGRIVFIKPKN